MIDRITSSSATSFCGELHTYSPIREHFRFERRLREFDKISRLSVLWCNSGCFATMDDPWFVFCPMSYTPPTLQQLAQNALGEDNEILLPLLVNEWVMSKDSHWSKLFTSISTSAYLPTSNYADLYPTEAQKTDLKLTIRLCCLTCWSPEFETNFRICQCLCRIWLAVDLFVGKQPSVVCRRRRRILCQGRREEGFLRGGRCDFSASAYSASAHLRQRKGG